jgi:hypothetical protein
VDLFNSGTLWWVDAGDADAREQQDMRQEQDPWQSGIAEFSAELEEVTIDEVLGDWAGLDRKDWDRLRQMRAARCLKAAGFRRVQRYAGKKRWWVYVRGE